MKNLHLSNEDESKGKFPSFNIFKYIKCKHKETVKVGWIDYTNGIGWMSDSYTADVCLHCGKILNRKKTF
jgi:hypothetical protein